MSGRVVYPWAALVVGFCRCGPMPVRPGHGLWLVRQLADRMRVLPGARGTRATVTFNLPGRRSGRAAGASKLISP